MIDGGDGGRRRRVETIANVLIETFGDRAIEVAQTQCELAQADSAEVWGAVVNHLAGE